jgi:hypothetical protein
MTEDNNLNPWFEAKRLLIADYKNCYGKTNYPVRVKIKTKNPIRVKNQNEKPSWVIEKTQLGNNYCFCLKQRGVFFNVKRKAARPITQLG